MDYVLMMDGLRDDDDTGIDGGLCQAMTFSLSFGGLKRWSRISLHFLLVHSRAGLSMAAVFLYCTCMHTPG